MRIDNSYLSGLSVGETRANAESGEAVQKADLKANQSVQATTHVPSPELANLVQLVQTSPDVRADAVTRASLLLQSGYYTSSEAAGRTAQAIIQAID